MVRTRLFAASSLVAISAAFFASAAMAQDQAAATAAPVASDAAPAEPAAAGEIVVTGSRIAIAGYSQPTPVTVVNEAVLQRDARPNIGDSVRELPAVGNSSSPNNTAGAGNIVAGITGLDTVNLRNLGVTRTLVLFDGQRVVQSNVTGQIDLGTVPTMLVQRIDVVTAGASAAWGSDAVAGVVNLVINKKFDGIRASVEGGSTYKFDRDNYRLSFAAGTGFNEGRGRVIIAGNYFNAPENVFANQRKWNRYRQLVVNPAYTATNGQPRLIHADNVNLAGATTGGLIVGGTCVTGVTCNTNALNSRQFTGQSGALAPFTPGIVSGQVASDAETLQASLNNLAIRYRTSSLFGYASYEFTDWLKASVQLNYGTTYSKNNSVPSIRTGTNAVNVRADNAFLPDAVRQQMQALNLATIRVGTTNLNNLTEDTLSYDNFIHDVVGVPVATTKRTLKRGVFTLEGDLGGGWSWNAYYQRGEVKVVQRTLSNVITANYAFAADAVRDPATGNIVCRATLQGNPAAAGCVPLNIFGTGVASQAAIRYVNVKEGQNYQIQNLTENVVAASAQGTLPFGLPAGNVAVAFGAEYRDEKGVVNADPGAVARLYSVANFPTFYGKYHVKEAFVEVDVPLIEDSFVKSLSLNSAGRITDYSTSGVVKTWKIGLTSQVNDSIRLRGTVSRDIRAPNLNELFSTGLSTLANVPDLRANPNGSVTPPNYTVQSGNPNLKPEVARTYSAGIVLSPTFLRRFNISVDYYQITLKGAINSIGSTEVQNRCLAGETQFCPQLIYNGAPGPNGPLLSDIRLFPQNLASLKTEGLDFQTDYTLPFLSGDLQLRVLGNYIFTLRQNQLGQVVNYAGAIGPDNPVTGVPRARFTASATYDTGPLSFTAQTRFIGGAKLVYTWTKKDVDDNSIPAVAYVDLRGSYQITPAIQFFAAVDNLLNQAPPNVAAGPTQGQTAYYFTPIAGQIYDQLGRSYRAGVRFRF
ncbi:TonB-dependent receptor domain-containing protein [Sphingomonas quercus]|uniref:TonB-dependent receptor n=1 Tax=Sphingomonas quercus TaxID=2842451 RepID=A0ABS6BJU4_9SPHN|nr:TonB-dependent receptor [Sphingomonas quercus]MBU3078568.1 TonB-dependent receptor [Sphingomonas quercus]